MYRSELEDQIVQVVPRDLREELQALWETRSQGNGKSPSSFNWADIINLNSRPQVAWGEITVRRPSELAIGAFSRIDPNCYISPKLSVGRHSHIAHNVTIGGGDDDVQVALGNHVGLAAGSRIYAISDDPRVDPFSAYPVPLNNLFQEGIRGNVTIENHAGVALNAVVLPGGLLKEGAFVLPLSQVGPNLVLEPWTIYAGIGRGLKKVGERDPDKILQKTSRIERFAKLAIEVQALLGINREAEQSS